MIRAGAGDFAGAQALGRPELGDGAGRPSAPIWILLGYHLVALFSAREGGEGTGGLLQREGHPPRSETSEKWFASSAQSHKRAPGGSSGTEWAVHSQSSDRTRLVVGAGADRQNFHGHGSRAGRGSERRLTRRPPSRKVHPKSSLLLLIQAAKRAELEAGGRARRAGGGVRKNVGVASNTRP